MPAPDGYLLGAKRLGVDPADCLVFEDVAAGVLAGEGAGASVLVIGATHTHPLETTHATITDYRDVVLQKSEGALRLLRAA